MFIFIGAAAAESEKNTLKQVVDSQTQLRKKPLSKNISWNFANKSSLIQHVWFVHLIRQHNNLNKLYVKNEPSFIQQYNHSLK